MTGKHFLKIVFHFYLYFFHGYRLSKFLLQGRDFFILYAAGNDAPEISKVGIHV